MNRSFKAFILLISVLVAQSGFCESPKETLIAYQKAIQSGDHHKAWEMEARRKDLPDALLKEERKMFGHNAERMKDWNFEILAECGEEDSAMVVICESRGGEGAMPDLDPVFLIKQDGSWKICSNKDAVGKIDSSKLPALDKLEAWFEGFKKGASWQRSQKDR